MRNIQFTSGVKQRNFTPVNIFFSTSQLINLSVRLDQYYILNMHAKY